MHSTEKYILLFHRVSPVTDQMWAPIKPENFENILKYAIKKFEIVPLNELIFQNRCSNSKPLATITFDDGYKDFIEFSLPVLKKYNLPSTLFVVTDCIDKNIPTWTYLSDHYFFNTQKTTINNTDTLKNMPGGFQKTSWLNREERVSYGKKIKQYLKMVPSKTRNDVLRYYFDNFNDVELPSEMMLSWEDLLNIKSEGVEIGSHSMSHSTLATIEDDTELRSEFSMSKEKLISELGEISKVFSYPCGSFNERVKTFCREAGYEAGVAVKGKPWDTTKEEDIFEIPRIELYNEPLWKSKLRISGMYQNLKNWRRKLSL